LELVVAFARILVWFLECGFIPSIRQQMRETGGAHQMAHLALQMERAERKGKAGLVNSRLSNRAVDG